MRTLPGKKRGRNGSATILLIMLLGIMTMYLVGNAVALSHLKREILLAEKKQERARLERLKQVREKKPDDHGQDRHD